MKAVHRGFTSGVLSSLFLLAGCVAWSPAPAIFAALLHGRSGRGKIPPCVGKKTGGARSEMCRA